MPSRSTFPPPDWLAVKRLYDAAVELDGTARDVFIAAADVTEAIRAEVRSLLAYGPDRTGNGSGGFLSEPAASRVMGAQTRIGERLGPWQIVRPIGSGGMGEVFEARRWQLRGSRGHQAAQTRHGQRGGLATLRAGASGPGAAQPSAHRHAA